MTKLAVKNLSVTISGKTICHQLTNEFLPGQVWGILGTNGVGKTTLMHSLCLLRNEFSGEILLDNNAISSYSRKELAQLVGIQLQHIEDPFPSTVLETVLDGRHPFISNWQWETKDDIDKAKQALAVMGLSEYSDREVNRLSGGERQRVSLAMLITQNPQIFLLDEPNSHLDLHYQVSSLDYLTRYTEANNRLLIMNLHDINLAARYCTHIILMQPGGAVLTGTAEDMLTEEKLTATFNHPVFCQTTENQSIFYPG